MQISKASFVRGTEKISFFTGDEKFIAAAALMLFAKTALCVRRSSERNAYFSFPFYTTLSNFRRGTQYAIYKAGGVLSWHAKNTFCQFSLLFLGQFCSSSGVDIGMR
jgi:hypothetical protein